ncbi:hypothetical protein WJX79_002085 [Trebouxia sp. C0005]
MNPTEIGSPRGATCFYIASYSKPVMSDWWDGQLDSLQTSAEIFYHLTSAEEGGNKNLSVYQEFRASRLQLRFAQDLVTCIQIFISKEKELYERDRTATEVERTYSLLKSCVHRHHTRCHELGVP